MTSIGNPDAPNVLQENILQFVRLLRRAGMQVGSAAVLDAVGAIATIGVERREDFYWALHACLVTRHEQHPLFDQAFRLFWRSLDQRNDSGETDERPEQDAAEPDLERVSRRLAEAMQSPDIEPERDEDEQELDAHLTWSAAHVLAEKDFEQMSAEELEMAKRAIARLKFPVPDVVTRRFRSDGRGSRIDIRRTLSRAVRDGGDIIPLAWKSQRRRQPPIVTLCDISGSMSRYSRMFLHFLHAVSNAHTRAHVFLFGTELTNITRALARRDVDLALEDIGTSVTDWSGGTRIGASLRDFNRRWGRRVLGQGATVLLITDGLDREGADGVEAEIARLRRSCRRLIWLNPLMRFDEYAPLALGAQAIAPHVDDMRTIHNLDSMDDLVDALTGQRGSASYQLLLEGAA